MNAREPKIVNGPEILNKYVGGSEEKLKNILASEQQITEHKNLHIVKVSNIFDAEELKEPLKDADVVMSTLGFSKGST